MTELQYKQWENDSQHDSYNTANERRLKLFSEKIEGLQVKVKRTSEGKFVVKTRVPLPPKPAPKKKAPAKTRKKTATATKTTARKTTPKAAAPKEEPKPAAPKPEAKKRTRKTSRKRK
tara:strand:+ start:160 stop:513 length:354 start_codon:yes stop_codon:yes gene_type:complete